MKTIQYTSFFFLLLISLFSCQEEPALVGQKKDAQWYKGNLHTHSLWSDGDDYPEMIMDWYQSNGYHFVGLSDHNILQEGEKWVRVPDNKVRRSAFEAYLEKYGTDWVESREDTSGLEVRLKTLEEYRSLFEEQDAFLILKSEEITDGFEGKPIHINATNLQDLIEPRHGNSVVEVMQNNIDAVLEQRAATGQPMFPHINHPNFVWGITAEDMMQLEGERFFEVFNGHPLVNNYGDSTRIGTEQMWDLINHHYLQKEQPLMYGLATDDSHHYHLFGPEYSNAGRAWVMVESEDLEPEALIRNLEAGNFYSTTGVELEYFGISYNDYVIKVKPEEGVKYQIQIIAWLEGDDQARVVGTVDGESTAYSLGGNELFVRAKIISDKKKDNPFMPGDFEVAWTQPVEVK
jgi:hypothetical protein